MLKSCKVCSLQSKLQSSWIKHFGLLKTTINHQLPIHSYRNNCFAARTCVHMNNLKIRAFLFLVFFLVYIYIYIYIHPRNQSDALSTLHLKPQNCLKRRLKDRPKPLMHNCVNLVILEHKRVLKSCSEF